LTACWKVGIQKNYLALQPLRIAACCAMTLTFDPDDFLEQFNTADIASAVAAADGT